jgi:hypothetical protein
VTPPVSPGVRQHNTHEELVGHTRPSVTRTRGRGLDAIIVPASRPAQHLDHAASLAEAEQCRLVVLCSREARADKVNALLEARPSIESVVIDLPSDYEHRWLTFGTTDLREIGLPEPCAARDTDLSTKRNIGLLLARMLDWDRVFFMDDDITGVDAGNLRSTVSMLGQQYCSVGMRVSEFPDNSVVCHAHRRTGNPQDVFVSGSVLAIDCTAPVGFFPNVYNEDWLFFYNDVVEGRLGCSGLPATQLEYDPFDDPRRAVGQEFGDVLAEGLYALLHRGQRAAAATTEYWANFLDARRAFLDAIIARADSTEIDVRQKLLDSVMAARECSAQIEPSLCADYVELWQNDLGQWEQTLKEIPRLSSVTAALAELGFGPAGDVARDGGVNRGTTATGIAGADLAKPALGSLTDADSLTMLSSGSPPLELLSALANADQMDRLQQTGVLTASVDDLRVGQAKKLAAMGRLVGVYVVVGVLFAYNGVRLALNTGGAAHQHRAGRHRRAQRAGRPRRRRSSPAIHRPT